MVDAADDDTAPTARRGADPLIVNPKRATGETGQVERPGARTPWWFVPGLCAVSLLLIGLLVIAADHRRDAQVDGVADPTAVDDSAPIPPGDGESETLDAEELAVDQPDAEPGAETAAASNPTVDSRIDELPPVGTVRYGDSDRQILTRCEVHLPFDPVDTEFQTSSYFFFDSSGVSQMIDRISTPSGDRAALERGNFRFVDLEPIGDEGAFAARFDSNRRIEVIVHPPNDEEDDCGDRVVTNSPGQFAEPHTRIVLDVCTDLVNDTGTTISGLTSQGARFEILQAGGELAEIVFDPGDGREFRTAAPAFVIRNDGILSASGVVSDGTVELDITIDIGSTTGERNARSCAPSDRL
ncbi:MAG: hypothetical protein AB8G26_02945 [Ilumatobacter sp.]